MKNKIGVVAKKELIRFFSDKRMIFTVLLFPGLIMYIMYSFIGSAFEEDSLDENYVYQVEAVGISDDMSYLLENSKLNIIIDDKVLNEEDIKNKLIDGEIDAYIILPDNFSDYIQKKNSQDSELDVPEVQIYYDSLELSSYQSYFLLENIFQELENSVSNIFDINAEPNISYDMADEEDTFSSQIAGLLPMILLVLSFAGCMGIATESIAGEKERGTIATVLVTPVKRRDIALGKVLSLAIISFISVCISSLSVFASLPNILDDDVDFSIYGIQTYFSLLLVMMSTVLFIVVIMVIISAMCDSVKEAHTAAMPFMIIVIVLGLSTLFDNYSSTGNELFVIPIYNSTQCLRLILLGQFGFEIIITIAANLFYSFVGILFLSKLLQKERIIFSY